MIIGLAGAKESGKNTAAKFIAEQFGSIYEITEWSFAAKLKQSAIAAITGIVLPVEDAVAACDDLKTDSVFQGKVFDPSEGEDYVVAEYSFTGREFLQWYGTEAHREIFGSDFWIDAVMNRLPNPDRWVASEDNDLKALAQKEWDRRIDIITDVRFQNEAEAIQDRGGDVIKIARPEVESSGDTHASEKPLPDHLVDHVVINDKDLNHFRNEVLDTMIFGVKA